MPDTAARLQEELDFARRWTLKPGFERFAPLRQLLANEFADPVVREQQLLQQLQDLLRYAGSKVPFYAGHWGAAGVDASAVGSLSQLERLPMISRHDVVSRFDALCTPGVDLSHPQVYTSRTSGSTGLPVKVVQSVGDLRMFALLSQRQMRWFRFDITGRMARIRLPKHLSRTAGGRSLRDGEALRMPAWTYVGEFFETGDEVHFNLNNSRASQIAWLKAEKPAYLLTFPPLLEELALANDCQPLPGLKGVVAVASMLTDAMRSRIEQSFGVKAHQGYGLNEFGMVGSQCEAGRYHTHTENTLVEIVDDQGHAVAPGETGRLVVTTLINRLMPLIRYDTGDVARAVAGPCRCGRTLPSFGEVLGRFVRYAGTPEGTRPRVNGLLGEVAKMPNELFTNIRQYQFYQTREEDFEIRVKLAGTLPDEFTQRLQDAWERLNAEDPGRKLRIVEVDEIPRTPSGKQLDFMSAFHELDPAFEANKTDSEPD